jgi:hypothetical protein
VDSGGNNCASVAPSWSDAAFPAVTRDSPSWRAALTKSFTAVADAVRAKLVSWFAYWSNCESAESTLARAVRNAVAAPVSAIACASSLTPTEPSSVPILPLAPA